MIDEHDTARVFNDVLLTAKMKIYSYNLRYCDHASSGHSEIFIYILIRFESSVSSISHIRETYNAFFQLPIRNSMNGIHNPAANALPTMKKVNFTRYLTLSLKAHSITKRNNSAMPLIE